MKVNNSNITKNKIEAIAMISFFIVVFVDDQIEVGGGCCS